MVEECSVSGCSSPVVARGLCGMHYRRKRLTGSVGSSQPSRNRPGTPLIERFWSFVERGGPDECWPWRGALLPVGLGQIKVGGIQRYAHRVGYELLIGPIPDGLVLDHMCHNRDLTCSGGVTCPHRRCVNPAHLEPATSRENNLRGRSFAAVNAAKTHCKNGHPFDDENTYMTPSRGGSRVCRTCIREAQRAYQARKRATS